ncbi:MAG: HNH endonuclease, partial [Patescibacteria group bacterium]
RYRKSSGSYVHRKVAEKILGRKLLPNEIVHHIDKNPTNNNPLNLAVMDNEKHILLHKGEIHLDDTSIILVSDLYHTNHKYKIINHKSETINHKGGIEKLRNKIKELGKIKSI